MQEGSLKPIGEMVDLFGNSRFKDHRGKLLSERSGLVKYFHERAHNRQGERFEVSYIAMILSHLTLQDLYAFKSMLEDRARTKKGFNWNKDFFWELKFRENAP